MNTLISILVIAFIVLVSLIVGFLAGLHAAKLGMQEIIRDTLIKNKKDEPYGYDCTDSDYDGDDEDQQYQVWPVASPSSSSQQQLISRKEVGNIHQKHRPPSPSHRTNHTKYYRYSTIPTEQHYTLSGDSLAPHHLFGSSSSTSTSTRSEVKNDTCSSSVYVGDGTYLARI